MFEFEITWKLDGNWENIDREVNRIVGNKHNVASGGGFGQRDLTAGGYRTPVRAEEVRAKVKLIKGVKCSKVREEEKELD